MAKRFIALFLMIVFAVCMSSCASVNKTQIDTSEEIQQVNKEAPVRGGTLNLCMFEVDSLNPLNTQNENNSDVLRLMFDGLFSVMPDFSLENNLCESYTVSEDGLLYSFLIKNDIQFHDGTILNANDVDASFKLIFEAQSFYAQRFSFVSSTSVSGMTWNVSLSEPVVNFPALLDFPVLPAKDARMDNKITNLSYIPIGTGIYKVSDYKQTKELNLVINENHFSGKNPYIPDIKITFVSDRNAAISMFENLYVDILPDYVVNLDEYTPKRDMTKSITYPENKLTFLGINNQKPVLLSTSVRQAISMCIDKNTIVNNTKTRIATPSYLPINPYYVYFSGEKDDYIYNVERALSLLNNDGFYDNDSNGILEKSIYGETHSLSLNLLVNSENSTRIKIAETIKASLEKAGFYINLSIVDFDTYKRRIERRDYDHFVGSVNISQNNDLSFMLQTDKNMFGISNEKIDLCLAQLKVLSNTTSILSVYVDLCSVLAEEMPISAIYYDNALLLCDKKIRGNIAPAESNVFINIHEWFIKE